MWSMNYQWFSLAKICTWLKLWICFILLMTLNCTKWPWVKGNVTYLSHNNICVKYNLLVILNSKDMPLTQILNLFCQWPWLVGNDLESRVMSLILVLTIFIWSMNFQWFSIVKIRKWHKLWTYFVSDLELYKMTLSQGSCHLF